MNGNSVIYCGKCLHLIIILSLALLMSCSNIPIDDTFQAATEKLESPQELSLLIKQADDLYEQTDVIQAQKILEQVIAKDPYNDEALWRLSRCCHWLYDENLDDAKQQEQYALSGIEYAQKGRIVNPVSTPSHYYYAICLGLYSQLHPLSSLGRVKEMIRAGKYAVEIDGAFDHAGPHRLLGYIYLEAPESMGIGDLDLALEHFAQAYKIAPDFAANLVAQAKAFAEDDRLDEARKLLEKVQKGEGFQGQPETIKKAQLEAQQVLEEYFDE